MISAASRAEPKAVDRMKKIATTTPSDNHRSWREAWASFSNCPPDSM